jgi:hypothetical protein
MTRKFHLGDILSVTTGRLLSPRHMDGIYEILNWLTGDSLFTHQLPRASRECEEPLLAQHPDLAGIEVPELDGEAEVVAWLAVQVERYGETREVAPLAASDHTHINPIAELHAMAPHVPVIGVVVDG